MHPKHADSIANSADPDQTVPLGAVRSGSALFAQTNLFENLGSLWYVLSRITYEIEILSHLDLCSPVLSLTFHKF